MGEVELLSGEAAGAVLVSEVEAFLAGQHAERALVEVPAVWSGPVEREYVEQVRVVPSAGVVAVLSGAIGLIVRDGWVQGRYRDGRGFCLVGAVEGAGAEAGFAAMQAAKFCVDLALIAATGRPGAIRWNDDLRRTREDVLGLLAAAVTVAQALGAR